LTPQWQLRGVLAACFVVSLLPLAICLPLWRHVGRETLEGWRRAFSKVGLELATVAALLPPVWLVTMQMLSRAGDNDSSRLLAISLEAVIAGLVAAILAVVTLCFAKGRVRSLGITACALTLLLFLLSFVVSTSSVIR
jgi:chromate transport protein ChrA